MSTGDEDRERWFSFLRHHSAESYKNWWVAFCLSLFLGWAGADRFYLGYGATAIWKLITCGGLGFWCIFDIVLILLGKMKDSEGRIVKRPFGK